jgi:hypothetical protein
MPGLPLLRKPHCAVVYNDFTKEHDFSQATYRIKTLAELKDIVRSIDPIAEH